MDASDPFVDALLALVERRREQPLTEEQRRLVRDALASSGMCDQGSMYTVPDGTEPAFAFRPFPPPARLGPRAEPDGAAHD